MTAAIVLFALGLADWLTTRAIIRHGGYERNPIAQTGIKWFGFAPFFIGKALAMGAIGALFPLWASGIVALAYCAVLVNNLIVLRRLT